MKLFKYEGSSVVVEPEALLLKPFKAIWDDYADKDDAELALGYVYFFIDPRSDFMIIEDPAEREAQIKKEMGFPKSFKISKKIQAAIEFYQSFKPASVRLLESSKTSASKIQKELDKIDYGEIEDVSDKLRAMSIGTDLLTKLNKAAVDIANAEKAVNTDMAAAGGKTRGNVEKSVMEDFDD